MDCSEIRELLSAYHDGELDDQARNRVSVHLAECPDCASQLATFEKLSAMAGSLSAPAPPEHLWDQLEEQLERPRGVRPRTPAKVAARLLATAAMMLVVLGAGWFAYQMWFSAGPHAHFAAEFGDYLAEFRRDPMAAQQVLLAKYDHQLVEPGEAVQHVGYRPAIANGLPDGYTVVSTHVVTMPCCKCVQSLCQRPDGSTLALFEHNDEETIDWFGQRPQISAVCNGERCSLVQLDDRIAASWKYDQRSITLIGVKDISEVAQIAKWLNEHNPPALN